MIAIIRIKGMVKRKVAVSETLYRLRLRRKYSCVVLPNPTKEQIGMLKSVKDFVAYGEISPETLSKLIEVRGQLVDKNKATDLKKVAEELANGKKYEELNLKPFFRLHPARKGIDTKKHFGVDKGVLGNNKDKINQLIERML